MLCTYSHGERGGDFRAKVGANGGLVFESNGISISNAR
jgi:hypothetical protein